MHMGDRRAPQHPMKMGGGSKGSDLIVSCLKQAKIEGSPDAMNMAWTVMSTSTMFRALYFIPHINSSKGDP
jgi:hypothetical protein